MYNNNHNHKKLTNSPNKDNNIHMVVPYIKVLGETFNLFVKMGIQVYFKGDNTIRNQTVAPKDTITQNSAGISVTKYKCEWSVMSKFRS